MADKPESRDRIEQRVLNRLRDVFDQHRWIVATEFVPGSVGLSGAIRDLTEQPILSVGAAEGAGMPPGDLSFEVLNLGMPPGETMVDTMHRGQALLADPEPELQALIDSWDKDRSARAIVSFTSVEGQAMGRPTFGARPESWRVLEDKLAVESIWAAAGVSVAPSRQVETSDRAAILAAHDELATASGTVWAGDNSSGWHGGGAGTFWVPDLAAAEQLLDRMDRFDRIRVMPFVEGVPCSMHGMVVPDGGGGSEVITFRPCEMLVLRDRAKHAFVYCRSATFWDPDPADRSAMADTAKRIGRELAALVDYRGMFTVDGVLGAEGFVPSEVNTRYGAALRGRHPAESGEILNLILLNMAVIEGQFDDVDLRPVGTIVTAALDAQRHGNAFINCSARPEGEQMRTVDIGRGPGGRLVCVEPIEGEHSDSSEAPPSDASGEGVTLATVQWTTMGPDAGVVNINLLDPPVGPSVAPLLVEIIELVNQRWSLGIAALEPAVAVR